MKRKILIIMMVALSMQSFAKEKIVPLFEYGAVKNAKWEDVRKTPLVDKKILKSLVKTDDFNSVIMKHTNLTLSEDNFYTVNAETIIANSLYTYNTLQDNKIIQTESQTNKLIFENPAFIANNSTITLRTNITENIADSVTFKALKGYHINLNVINTQNENSRARYKKIYLLGVPEYANMSVSLGNPPVVQGIKYELTKTNKNGMVYYFLTPTFNDYSEVENLSDFEDEFTDNSQYVNSKPNKKLREIVNIITFDKSMTNSSVIDID